MTKRRTSARTAEPRIKAGGHVCMLQTEPDQLSTGLAFLARGVAEGEVSVMLSYGRLLQRVEAQLRDLHGVDVRAAQEEGSLFFVAGGTSAAEMIDELTRVLSRETRGRRPARLLTSLGYGEPGWPDEEEIAELDARLNTLCEGEGVAALCMYDVRQLSGEVVHGALEAHPVLLHRGELVKSSLHVDPQALQTELRARRKGDDRLRAWIS